MTTSSNNRTHTYKAHLTSNQDPRPILTSLNGDNSWLISIPRPITDRKTTGKAYFHIVHDPWLSGPETQGSKWLVHLTLSAPPAAHNGREVEGIAREIEDAAVHAGVVSRRAEGVEEKSLVDAIFVGFHYGDHLHAPTLRTFDKRIPVFATRDGAPVVRRLDHFDTVVAYGDFEASMECSTEGGCSTEDSVSTKEHTELWTAMHPPHLPPWLSICRVKGHHELNFLTALLWTNVPDTSSPTKHEAILSSPHGLHTSTSALQSLLHSSFSHPSFSFSILALLHGLKESWTFNWQTTFGVASGLELYRASRAKYWVATHNDKLGYGGLVWWLVTDIFRTVEWGLGREREREKGREGSGDVREEVRVQEVPNGGCFVLE